MITRECIADGLARGEFFLEYLPTVSLVDGRCVGAEALARWRRPSGVVPPQEFIPIAEKSHLIGLITYWVVETVGAELGDWMRAHADVHVSINVPPEILGRGGLEYAATKAGLQDLARQFVLEVTERSVPDQLGVNALAEASRRGVRIALDDVNVSGANIIVLSRCQVEMVKLDRDLVSHIKSGEAPDWLEALSGLLRTTTLEVVAEGVENEDQSAMLQQAGVKLAQGYFFSPPLRAQEFTAFFASRRRPAS
jgi:sensor c-di-GMP phosphodiesterase-like protein